MKRKALRRRNDERHAEQLERQFGDLADFVRWLHCSVCSQPAFAEPHHVRNRRMWGAWLEDLEGELVGNLAPLCHDHHRELHAHGAATFERRHGVRLADVARKVGERFLVGEDPIGVPW